MIIVGITGNIANGKSTFGEYLARNASSAQHWESWQLIAEIAAGLRQTAAEHPRPTDLASINTWLVPLSGLVEVTVHRSLPYQTYRLTAERLARHPDYYSKLQEYLQLMNQRPELRSVTITKANKEAFRSLLQWLGGYLVELLGEGTWYDEILRRIHASKNIELATIGGVRFPGEAQRITKVGGWVLEINRPGQSNRDMTDLTERQRSLIKPDTVILNDAGLTELAACAGQLYLDLMSGQLAPEYRASAI